MRIKENEALAPHTTLHVGGVADYVIGITSLEELKAACPFVRQTGRPPLILGGGSNLLVSDEGYRGAVLHMQLRGRHYEGEGDSVLLTVGAGEVLDEVVAETVGRSLWGLENLSAIPGSVGATPVQNVGAYGVEVASLITQVQALDWRTGQERMFSAAECNFSYRDSWFKTAEGKHWVITAVTFALSLSPQPQLSYADLSELRSKEMVSLEEVRETVKRVRAEKFPDWTVVGTAGSFFKNPIIPEAQFITLQAKHPDIPGYVQADGQVKVSLGWILDKLCGLKGYREGTVGLYEKQALVLVAERSATAGEIEQFVSFVTEKVFTTVGIKIETEVQRV